jgi:hypothetical protein
MKKIILGLALLFALGSTIRTSAQETQRVRFYYYPSSNVYYNVSTGEYWYYDNGTTNWVEVKTLPTTIIVTKTSRYTVYYNGPDVWKENATHQKKYKSKKGTTTQKTKSTGQQK